MKYARYLRVAVYTWGGGLVGIVTSLILLYLLIVFDVFDKCRGIGWPVVLILLIAVFYAGGLLVGTLGSVDRSRVP